MAAPPFMQVMSALAARSFPAFPQLQLILTLKRWPHGQLAPYVKGGVGAAAVPHVISNAGQFSTVELADGITRREGESRGRKIEQRESQS